MSQENISGERCTFKKIKHLSILSEVVW